MSTVTTAAHRHATPGYHDKRHDHLDRLAKIEGQVRGLSRMVQDDRYCVDVLTQISAVTKALQQVGLNLLDEHIRHCVLEAAITGGELSEERFAEVRSAIQQTLRL